MHEEEQAAANLMYNSLGQERTPILYQVYEQTPQLEQDSSFQEINYEDETYNNQMVNRSQSASFS
jgi:hypothetical protein